MMLENIFCETCGGQLELNDTGTSVKCIVCGNTYLVKDEEPQPGFVTDGKGTITAYQGNETSLAIPARIDGVPITAIGYQAFSGKGLANITIPKSVTRIDEYAFKENRLTNVVIPPGVTFIGNGAFIHNRLTSVTLGDDIDMVNSFNNEIDKLYHTDGKKAATYVNVSGQWVNSRMAGNLKMNMTFFDLCVSNKLAEAKKIWNEYSIDLAYTALGDNTALNLSTEKGHTEVAKWLIEIGSPLDTKNMAGQNALRRASFKGNTQIVKALLEAGADPNIVDKDGCPPLIYAVKSLNIETVSLLLEHDADPAIPNKANQTAINYAAQEQKWLRNSDRFDKINQIIILLAQKNGGYAITTKMLVDSNRKVRFMYREEPSSGHDSGWRFSCGDEAQDYYEKSENLVICNIATILSIDPSIKPYLESSVNTAFGRENENDEFRILEDFEFGYKEFE
jgi:DNA-directed RNA polymerase subunit RPC12/RpoP